MHQGAGRTFAGRVTRLFASLRAVLRVNNSLSGRVAVLLLGLAIDTYIYMHVCVCMYRLKHCRECYMKNKARGNEAEMANIARGEAEFRVLYFSYSTSKRAML